MNKTEEQIIGWANSILEPLGLEVIAAEVQRHRENRLRLYIDRLESIAGGPIGVEDCARASHALDSPLDETKSVASVFGEESYELEVSSPGIERPLRTEKDFRRFNGQPVRVHTFRPLTAEELQSEEYFKKNPRQKNFTGILDGFENDFLWLKNEHRKGRETKTSRISIPFQMISKANLEPDLSQVLRKEKRA